MLVDVSVYLIEYDKYNHEYKALKGNEVITVDPYVGCVWENDCIKLGKFKFRGHWYQDCFIVAEEIIE